MYSTQALDQLHERIDLMSNDDECADWNGYDTLKALNNFILAVYHEAIHTQNTELITPSTTECTGCKTKGVKHEANAT